MTEISRDPDRWFRRFQAAPNPSYTLVCFPHAGGAATVFHPLSVLLAPNVSTVAVQYPGRQERRTEPVVEDIGTLADIASELLPALGDGPFAFFGHSMGAVIAFETAQRLERRHPGAAPVMLFASGRRAPGAGREERIRLLPDDGLIAHLTGLGGPGAQVLQDEEMRALLLPAIRGDYVAIENYRCRQGTSVGVPVSVLTGDRDPLVTLAEAEAWREHTTGPSDVRVFSGGHFFLTAEFPAVAAHIRDRLLDGDLAGGANSAASLA
jgi:surfactin synthase thioesterase subunit